MFYLRKVKKKSRMVSNSTLGVNYCIIHKDLHKEEFSDAIAKMSWIGDDKIKNIYKFLSDSSGKLIPLSVNDDNYIVTENGNTYEKL